MIHLTNTNGHDTVWLENKKLRISVLPGKGADIADIIHVPSGVDFLMKAPWGLKPPAETPPTDFLENYEGGWQELFPNPNDAATFHDAALPFHGEAALLPWQWQPLGESDVLFWTDCRITPFRLERRLRLLSGKAGFEAICSVTNLSEQTQPFLWGQHIVLGGAFLEDGCRMEIPAQWIITPETLFEPETATLAPGQRQPWPMARLRHDLDRPGLTPGGQVDLRHIPGPQARLHEDIYLTGLERGELTVTNPRLRLAYRMEWDPAVFGCITNWRPLGGAIMPPLTGIYGLGIEPWFNELPFDEALRQGKTLQLEPQATLRTTITTRIQEI